jgi:hypothetical protein
MASFDIVGANLRFTLLQAHGAPGDHKLGRYAPTSPCTICSNPWIPGCRYSEIGQ